MAIEKAAKRGDLLVYPATFSAVASASAERDGTARSYSKTIWRVGVVTSVSRESVAIGFRTYSQEGVAHENKGPISGQYVGSAEKCAPLTADDLARRFASTDFPSVAAARDAILDAIARAKGGK